MLSKYRISSWSFDKGFWRKKDKELLHLKVPKVIMPKLGRRNISEQAEETSYTYKRLKNKNSAIESNINEPKIAGLDRCPDRGLLHYKTYISFGVCAFNLKKTSRQLLEIKRKKSQKQQRQLLTAA
jgi:hypothetical protein